MRVPNTGPAERERLELVARLETKLRYFQSIAPWRREAETADVGENTCRMMLTELGARTRAPQHVDDGTVTLMTMDEFFAELEIR